MTGVVPAIPKIQFSNSQGVPLANGSVTVYIAGSTTLATTYQDEALTAANPNPVPLDSQGCCTMFLDPDEKYKFVLKNASGVTQSGWPVDTISGAQTLTSLAPKLAQLVPLTDLAGNEGSALTGFMQAGVGAVLRTVQDKGRELLDAADYIDVPGASEALDKAGVQAAINEAQARGGGRVRVRKPIRNVWKLSALTIPAGVIIDDERYCDSGHTAIYATGGDVEFRQHGISVPSGEGPSFTTVNNATTGDRTGSLVHRYGDGIGDQVGMYMHMGVWDGTNWFREFDMITPGADGFRSNLRVGYGTVQINAAYTGAFQYTQNKIFTVNKPAALGGGPLLELMTGAARVTGELHVASTNAPVRHCYADGTPAFSWLSQFPSGGHLTLYDHDTGQNKLIFASSGDTLHRGTFRSSLDNTDNLGGGGNRWATIYAGTATINTSDTTEKQQIEELNAAEKAAALTIKAGIKRFKFNDAVAKKGAAARIHVGVIAQEVAAAFEAQGLDPAHYALFCSDTWKDERDIEHTRLGIRYDELLAFVISAM